MRSKRFLYTSALYRAEGGEPPRGLQWNKDTCAHTDMAALCKGKWTRLELPGGGELLCSLCSRPAKAVWLLLLKLYLSNRSRRLSTPSWCIALSTLQNACVHWDGFQISRFKTPSNVELNNLRQKKISLQNRFYVTVMSLAIFSSSETLKRWHLILAANIELS